MEHSYITGLQGRVFINGSSYRKALIAFITGVKGIEKQPQTANELFKAAMSQEIMQMIEI